MPFVTAVLGGEAQLRISRETGRVETINVKIPVGIEDGKKIRLRGQGGSDADEPGDLLIKVHVLPHPYFSRRGDHLDVKVPVTLDEAALGAKVDVPTPKGTISLRVPAGTSSGAKLRVKGHGVAAKGRPPGDLFAEIQIQLPKPLDAESLELIKQLAARAAPTNPRRSPLVRNADAAMAARLSICWRPILALVDWGGPIAQAGTWRADAMARLRVVSAAAVLLLVVAALLMTIAYLCRRWRRAVGRH